MAEAKVLAAAQKGLHRSQQVLLLESAVAAPKINPTVAVFTPVGTLETFEISGAAMIASEQKFIKARDHLRSHTNNFRPEQEARNMLSMHGIEVPPRPSIIPERFQTRISDNVAGIVYRDPLNEHNQIRVMAGKPHSPNLGQQKPYIKVQMHGNTYDKYGNRLKDRNAFESHIPYHEFEDEFFKRIIK